MVNNIQQIRLIFYEQLKQNALETPADSPPAIVIYFPTADRHDLISKRKTQMLSVQLPWNDRDNL
jgi:hypothetical protein